MIDLEKIIEEGRIKIYEEVFKEYIRFVRGQNPAFMDEKPSQNQHVQNAKKCLQNFKNAIDMFLQDPSKNAREQDQHLSQSKVVMVPAPEAVPAVSEEKKEDSFRMVEKNWSFETDQSSLVPDKSSIQRSQKIQEKPINPKKDILKDSLESKLQQSCVVSEADKTVVHSYRGRPIFESKLTQKQDIVSVKQNPKENSNRKPQDVIQRSVLFVEDSSLEPAAGFQDSVNDDKSIISNILMRDLMPGLDQDDDEGDQNENSYEDANSDDDQDQTLDTQASLESAVQQRIGKYVDSKLTPYLIDSFKSTIQQYSPSNYFHVGPRYQMLGFCRELLDYIVATFTDHYKLEVATSELHIKLGGLVLDYFSQAKVNQLYSTISQYDSSNYFHVGPRRSMFHDIEVLIGFTQNARKTA